MLTTNESKIVKLLLDHSDGPGTGWEQGWQAVYLDNLPGIQSNDRSFIATLGSLEKKGIYKPTGEAFGEVKA